MRFVSFNANGIRARLHQLEIITEKHQPDIIALQETKVADEQFPLEDLQRLGYPHIDYYGQKGHYGVALLSRTPARSVQLGLPWRDAEQQRRFIMGTYDVDGQPVKIINGYFPQGESRDHPTKFPAKRTFYADVKRYLEEACDPEEHVLIAGDMNVAPDDSDIGIGEENQKRWLRTGKTCFLPEERDWLTALTKWGLSDSYVDKLEDGERLYSWFDYRSRGFERNPKRGLRIDLILTSRALANRIDRCGIDYDVRGGDKPSDHCPIWCYFAGSSQ